MDHLLNILLANYFHYILLKTTRMNVDKIHFRLRSLSFEKGERFIIKLVCWNAFEVASMEELLYFPLNLQKPRSVINMCYVISKEIVQNLAVFVLDPWVSHVIKMFYYEITPCVRTNFIEIVATDVLLQPVVVLVYIPLKLLNRGSALNY